MPWKIGERIRIEVPGPPRALERNRHRVIQRGPLPPMAVSYLPAKSRNNQAIIRDFAQQAMRGRPPINTMAELRIVAFMPIPESFSRPKKARAGADQEVRPAGRPDADNLLKQVGDAIEGVVIRNDMRFTDVAIWKRYSDRPRLVIIVSELIWVKEDLKP